MADFFGIKKNKELKEITVDSIGALSSDNGAVKTANINDGAVTTAKHADKSVTLAKLADEAKYWNETARTNTDELGTYITKAWGHLWNYCWGTNQEFSMDGPEYARLDTFWESIIYAADSAIAVTLTDMPAIVNAETGESYGTTHVFTVPKWKTLWLKKISTAVMLVGGSFARPTITAGTADPTGGNDGDIYIQYSE